MAIGTGPVRLLAAEMENERCTGHQNWYWMSIPVVIGTVGLQIRIARTPEVDILEEQRMGRLGWTIETAY